MAWLRCSCCMVLLLCAACGTREGDTSAAPDSAPPAQSPAPPLPVNTPQEQAPPRRPGTRVDTVLIEGMPEVEEARLVTAPENFGLPFSTYVPEGLHTEFAPPLGVRFVAAFGGTVNRDAFMLVYIHEAGVARPAAADILQRLMSTRAVGEHETTAMERPAWAIEASGFRAIGADGTNYTGSISVGEHSGRYFHIVRHYPVEYGDGLPPRLHTIMRHWRWEDTGEPLLR